MAKASTYLIFLLCVCSWSALATEVSGRIILQKDLHKKVVMPAVYDLRGMALSDSSAPLEISEFERVAVWIESDKPAPLPPIRAQMEQRNRRLQPELLIVPEGSSVEFPNFDPMFHNIFSLSRARSFDLGYYSQGKSRTVNFPRTGIVQVYCHVHPNMYGAIVVTSSRWFAKPSSDGQVYWPNVPAGKYRFIVWQRFAGLSHKAVLVPKSGRINLTISIPDEQPDNR